MRVNGIRVQISSSGKRNLIAECPNDRDIELLEKNWTRTLKSIKFMKLENIKGVLNFIVMGVEIKVLLEDFRNGLIVKNEPLNEETFNVDFTYPTKIVYN